MSSLTEADELQLWELLPVPAQQAVARGDVTIADLLERMTAASRSELCPRCCVRPVSVHHRHIGWCATCAKKLALAASEERYAELKAADKVNAAKMRLNRLRDALEPGRERHAGPGARAARARGEQP